MFQYLDLNGQILVQGVKQSPSKLILEVITKRMAINEKYYSLVEACDAIYIRNSILFDENDTPSTSWILCSIGYLAQNNYEEYLITPLSNYFSSILLETNEKW